jgi:hexulose-6-phosphate isomerase
MRSALDRRQFLAASAGLAAGLGVGLGSRPAHLHAQETKFETKLYKALIRRDLSETELEKLKAAGFDGVEAYSVDVPSAERSRRVAEKVGVKIHSVLRGWADFNSPDKAKVEKSLSTTEDALRAAQGYGADAVLLVPCRIGGVRAPRPWEFQLDFDEKTGHIRKVTVGDNAPFADYIRAHNHATDTSREAIKRLIPVAEKAGVVLALENVWNNLWVEPAIFRSFVASFASPWVKAYFDIGNHVKYAPPEDWILNLNDLIVKCHVKDFQLNPKDPGGQGKFVNIRDGSVRWPVVRAALERVGYTGWMTIEGGNLSMEAHSERLDAIIQGQ